MKIQQIPQVLLIGSLALPGVLYAQGQDDSTLPASGVYIGAALGKSDADAGLVDQDIITDLFDDIFSISGTLFVGYRIDPYVSVELGFNSYLSEEDDVGSETSNSELTSWLLSAKASYPVTDWFSPNIRIGADFLKQKITYRNSDHPDRNININQNEVAFMAGIGLDFILARRYTLALNWGHDFEAGDIDSFNNYNFAFSYTF